MRRLAGVFFFVAGAVLMLALCSLLESGADPVLAWCFYPGVALCASGTLEIFRRPNR